MTPLAQAISEALVQFAWQGFVVSLCAWVAMYLLRHGSPQTRYLVCCAALFVAGALPVVTAISVYDSRPVSGGTAAVTLTIRALWSGSAPAAARWLEASRPWVLLAWGLGVAFLSLRLAWLGAGVRAIRQSGSVPDEWVMTMAARLAQRMGLRRAMRVVVSAIPDGPSVAGWFRPAILLPAAAILNLTPEQLEAVLAHEMAHLRRYDDYVNIAQAAVETLLFYHPVVWWISNRIRRERELCCDDLAVRTCGDAVCYARALTALEKLRIAAPQLALGALGLADVPLEYRIRRIVGAGSGETMTSGVSGVFALGLAMACAVVYSGPVHGGMSRVPALVRYPEAARVNGIQGTVPVQVTVDADGRVDEARAVGGPKELRQAAVESAAGVQFEPRAATTTKQVNVEFQLATAAIPVPTVASPAPVISVPQQQSVGPRWVDQGEAELGTSANEEKDPAKKLSLLKEWQLQYPASAFEKQRTVWTAQTLMTVLFAAYGKSAANEEALRAGRQAALELLDDFEGYFNDSVRPDNVTPAAWAQVRRASELQIHTLFAYIARTERDHPTAEAEYRKVLEIDPGQAFASYEMGATIVREMSASGDLRRYPEALYDMARSLTVTGPGALAGEARGTAEAALRKCYASYHGSEDGLDELLLKAPVDDSLPPSGFHIRSVVEEQSARRPDLELWSRTEAALAARGDEYFQTIRGTGFPSRSDVGYAGPEMFTGTVVSQLSSRELLVNVGGNAGGDAVLKFSEKIRGRVSAGTVVQFRGVVQAYRADRYLLTLGVAEPAKDVVGLPMAFGVKRGNLVSRFFGRIFHGVRRAG